MFSSDCLREMRSTWLPNITVAGLDRLIDLLEKNSPLLIHGCFTRAIPMGCLATHAAWHHPKTEHLTVEAGLYWLNRVAGLNPATSRVIQEWDGRGSNNWESRAEMLAILNEEREARRNQDVKPSRRVPALSGPVEE